MENKSIPIKNQEGYKDPTAHKAMTMIWREEDENCKRFMRMLYTVRSMLDMAGYDLIGRLEVRDRETGRIYK